MNSGLSPCLPKHAGRCSAPIHHRPSPILLQRDVSGDQRQWKRYIVQTATDCQASGRCPSMHPALPRNPGRIPQAPRTRPMMHESIADSPSKINPRLLVQNPVLHQRLWKSRTFGAKPPIPHESASHSMGYEHAPSIVGEAGCIHQRCVTLMPPAVPSPPAGRRCQSPR